jgi:transposase
MTVSLGTQQDMREMGARGVPRAQVSRGLGVSRNTVAKYADMGDMSPAAPVSERRPRPATEAYRGWIDGVLEEDLGRPRKQRRTARRIYDRMASDLGCSGSYSSVCRYVALWRREHAGSSPRDGYLELGWAPGTAQADFGNFRCVLAGGRGA